MARDRMWVHQLDRGAAHKQLDKLLDRAEGGSMDEVVELLGFGPERLGDDIGSGIGLCVVSYRTIKASIDPGVLPRNLDGSPKDQLEYLVRLSGLSPSQLYILAARIGTPAFEWPSLRATTTERAAMVMRWASAQHCWNSLHEAVMDAIHGPHLS